MKILFLTIFISLTLFANYKSVKIASNLGVVWGMTFISSSELLLTQKNGEVKLLNIKTKVIKSIGNPPKVLYQGQGGLLDVAISPDFEKSGWIYFTYVKNINNQGATTLARAKLKEYRLHNWQELLVTKSTTSTTQHFGSRITFNEEGHVFFSVGDRGVRPNGQDLRTHAGTIIRLNLDGSIPIKNPFVNNKSALPEIYSYGHRNPQGLFYDKVTKKLYSIEHGPRGGDEINIIKIGANYGWPVISYGKEYWNPLPVGEGTHKKGMEQPIKVYIPSIAPSSLIVYQGEILTSLKGNLLSGALKLRHLNRIVLDKKEKVIKEERYFERLNERIRSLCENSEGELFFSTDSGQIYQVIKP